MSFRKSAYVLAAVLSFTSLPAAHADGLTPEQQANARITVETAANLAAIAESTKDGAAMLVAAKLLAGVGPVAKPGEALKDGKPVLLDVKALAESAKSLGADAGTADGVAAMSKPQPLGEYCYWYYNCDSNNNCRWDYICS
jgi:hypothetical protein